MKTRRWTIREVTFLSEHTGITDGVLAYLLGTTIIKVRNTRNRFGIVKDKSLQGFRKGYTPHNKKLKLCKTEKD